MYKLNYFSLLIVSLMFLSCSSKESPPIASIKQLHYKINDAGEKVLAGSEYGSFWSPYNYEIFFNNEGDTISYNELRYDGSLYNTMTMTYDENKRLVKKHAYNKDYTYEYDEKGKILFYKENGKISKEYQYDEYGKLLKKIDHAMAEFNIIDNDIYVYEGNRLIRVDGIRNTNSSYGDKSYIVQELKYDEEGNLVEKLHYLGISSILDYKEKYKNNKITEKIKHQLADNLGSEKEDITTFYNDKGQIMQKAVRNIKKNELSTTDYKYDDKGNLIEEIKTNPDGNKHYIRYKCKYDKYENLVETEEYYGDEKKPSYITIREIEYVHK